jgi:hypothetical protein
MVIYIPWSLFQSTHVVIICSLCIRYNNEVTRGTSFSPPVWFESLATSKTSFHLHVEENWSRYSMLCDFADLNSREILLINQKVDAGCRCTPPRFSTRCGLSFFQILFVESLVTKAVQFRGEFAYEPISYTCCRSPFWIILTSYFPVFSAKTFSGAVLKFYFPP